MLNHHLMFQLEMTLISCSDCFEINVYYTQNQLLLNAYKILQNMRIF